MANALLIFLTAGFGEVFRYWVSNSAYYLLGLHLPYGTLVANVSVFFDGLLPTIKYDQAWSFLKRAAVFSHLCEKF